MAELTREEFCQFLERLANNLTTQPTVATAIRKALLPEEPDEAMVERVFDAIDKAPEGPWDDDPVKRRRSRRRNQARAAIRAMREGL